MTPFQPVLLIVAVFAITSTNFAQSNNAVGQSAIKNDEDAATVIRAHIMRAETHAFDKTFRHHAVQALDLARQFSLPAEEGNALRALAAFTLEDSNPSPAALDSANQLVRQSLSLAQAGNDSSAMAWSNCLLGKLHYARGYWIRGMARALDSARSYLQPAIQYGLKHEMKTLLSECYHYYSLSLRGDINNFQTIVNLKLDALAYNDSLSQQLLRARILNHMGSLYLNFGGGLKTNSLSYFERALFIARKIGASDVMTSVLSDMSDYYMLLGQKEESLRYFHDAIEVARKGKLFKREASLYFQAGRIYLHFQDYKPAITNFKYCAVAHEKLGQQWAVPICRGFMAKGYLLNHQRDLAAMLIAGLDREVGDLIRNKSEFFSVKEILQVVISVYGQLNDTEGLARNQARLINLQDSVYSKQNQADFEGALAARNLELARQKTKMYEYERAIAQGKISRQRLVIFIMIGAVAILFLVAFGLSYYLRALRRLNQKLQKQSETIESQKQELISMVDNLKSMQGQLVSSEKMASLGHLAAGVAHELNNPLNFISGGVSVMEEFFGRIMTGNISLEDKKILFKESMIIFKNINNGVDRMSSIIESLQIYTNPREALTESSETDIADCVDASLILLKSKLEGESITIIRSYSTCKVRAHSGRLSQVFINLIDNAIHATAVRERNNRKLEIGMIMNDDTVRIDFTDNGTGIPEEVRNNIFHAFFTTKETGKGTGLGLFICHSIIDEFGGSLTFSTEVGKGTTFSVVLSLSKF